MAARSIGSSTGACPSSPRCTGAVLGGGLELALSAHVRVADATAFYTLPEGRLGIFVGGGGSVRIGRVIGADRMRELMLTALPRIDDTARADGLFTEALTTALSQSTEDAAEGVRAFLDKREPRFEGR